MEESKAAYTDDHKQALSNPTSGGVYLEPRKFRVCQPCVARQVKLSQLWEYPWEVAQLVFNNLAALQQVMILQ